MMPVLRISLVSVLICMSLLSSPNVSKADQSEPGRALFNGTTGAPGKARLGTTVLPARRFPCRNCHGRDGEGGNEGNAPAIVWRTLSGATVSRSAYDKAALAKLLRTGMNPDGEMISQLMPRYDLDEPTLASLTSYLKDLPAAQSAGITADQISIGVLVSAASGKHTAYATRLQFAIDQCSNGRPLYGRRLVVVPIDASDPEAVRRSSSGMAAVAGLANSRDFPLRFFTDLGIPVINPLFPLNGDEDDTIVRTMSPSWRDIFRSLLEQARSDGIAMLHLAETSRTSDTNLAVRTMIKDLSGPLKITPMPPRGDGSSTAGGQHSANPATAILVVEPLEAPDLITSSTEVVPVYAPLGHVASHLTHLLGQRTKLKVAIERSILFTKSTQTGQDPLTAHAELTARVICEAVRTAGRSISRARLIAAISNVDLADVELNWSTHPLTGTAHVPIETVEPE